MSLKAADVVAIDRPPIAKSGLGRLFEGQTSIDFVGRRKMGLAISLTLLAATVLSLFTQGLKIVGQSSGYSFGY